MLIRRGVPTDAVQLAELHLQVWREAYTGLISEEVLAAREQQPVVDRVTRWVARVRSGELWVAVSDGDVVVGWSEAGPGRDAPGVELYSLYVAAERYSTGLGHRLLVQAVGEQPAHVWVLRGNDRAIGFYERHGFAFDGAEKVDDLGLTDLRMVRA